MNEAIKLAIENVESGTGGPFGAVIVKNGEIIGRGVNNVTTNNDPTAHAEIQAIRDACQKLKSFQLTDCEIYTTCEPCPMCLGAIYWSRASKIYYGATKADAANVNFDDSFIYTEIEKPITERTIKTVQISREAALDVFKKWEKSSLKIRY